jgi:hypothetical protein
MYKGAFPRFIVSTTFLDWRASSNDMALAAIDAQIGG